MVMPRELTKFNIGGLEVYYSHLLRRNSSLLTAAFQNSSSATRQDQLKTVSTFIKTKHFFFTICVSSAWVFEVMACIHSANEWLSGHKIGPEIDPSTPTTWKELLLQKIKRSDNFYIISPYRNANSHFSTLWHTGYILTGYSSMDIVKIVFRDASILNSQS